MRFEKWHGLGNDFIVLDGISNEISITSEQAVFLCDRHMGIGADGVVILTSAEDADFAMNIINSDGSIAEMCGNATRCVAKYLRENGLTDKSAIAIKTLAGIIRPKLISNGLVCVDMGEPKLKSCEVPMRHDLVNGEEQAINVPLSAAGVNFNVTAVSIGNPHCVVFVDDVDGIDIDKYGKLLEVNKAFPVKINVEFVQVESESKVRMKVWERGAGRTMACGTGACATLLAGVLNGKISRKAEVELEGGTLLIEWREDNHVYMTGSASKVFEGVINILL